ncbi:MAG TPA: S-layer homology domain-containing protein [Anaerolineales bacterium]|nr:S-layer homology domain-containing protein [Anaerolineales bacterium]HND94012.1 S-layer homology domain-containing protein [Anaerolineales bacterium]
MSKKVFTVLLLAVFVLAQFSVASAAAVAGADITLTNTSEFLSEALAAPWASTTFEWTLGALPAGTTYYVDIYARNAGVNTYASSGECLNVATVNGGVAASGSFTYDFTSTTADGDTWEFVMTVDDTASCADGANVETANVVMHSAYVDGHSINGFGAVPPSDPAIVSDWVACNIFEYWAVGSDAYGLPASTPYSGIGDWNPQITGTFAPPAPIGPADEVLEWSITLPATASGAWTITISPEDAAGNRDWVAPPYYYRNGGLIVPSELEDCADFSDVSGHEYELYIRYLADIGMISGFADGTFGPDATLTRAEAATLIEISNGYDATTLPTSAPAGCDFTDVAASDWFAGWVWQACADGYMNGVGGGLFDPNNLLTRGQIVTILNNVNVAGPTGGILNYGGNVMDINWGNLYREAAWTDVSIGAFYAQPVINAYGIGIADGTSATTFSPDQPITRGEFSKMLYRALSIWTGTF